MNYGYVKVAAAIPAVKVANCEYNVEQILTQVYAACEQGVAVVCFPELAVTAYTCQDLFFQETLLEASELAYMKLLEATRQLNIITVVGVPVQHRGALYNCAAVAFKGRLLGLVPKSYLPNYQEFYEKRWFASGLDLPNMPVYFAGHTTTIGRRQLFSTGTYTFGVEICEDLWATIPPSSDLALQGAELVLNLSADNDGIGKHEYLKSLVSQQSARCLCGYVYAGCGFGESTQDIVFSGKGFIYEEGQLLCEARRFDLEPQLLVSEIDMERLRHERRMNTTFATAAARAATEGGYTLTECNLIADPSKFTLTRSINPHPFVPQGRELDERCEEIFNIQVEGLAKRMVHTGAETVVVGISGGLDSTLALLVCARTFDRLGLNRKGIVGITMPGFGTSDRTYVNAVNLMNSLGIFIREISIAPACDQHFKDLNIDKRCHDVTYENSQARERTQILMDAANQVNGLVVGTGDLSELALGWATYNGDHMSMYGVNASVPKTLVKHLVAWTAHNMDDKNCAITLMDIVDTPISPELIPTDEEGGIAQRTEDLVGPYELHDFFLYNFLRFGYTPEKLYFMACRAFGEAYPPGVIRHWLREFHRRFFQQQFKRSCLPDGPKVGSCSLSPRGDWRMASDTDAKAWMSRCDQLPT